MPPFDNSDEMELFQQIETGAFHFYPEYWSTVSDQAKDLIRRLLVVDPLKRYTVQEALSHPWIKSDSSLSSPPQVACSPVKQTRSSTVVAPSPTSVPGNLKKNITQLRV